MGLYLPRRFRSQPSQPAEVTDKSLVVALNGALYGYDSARGVLPTSTSNVRSYGAQGVGYTDPNEALGIANVTPFVVPAISIPSGSDFTSIIVVNKIRSATTYNPRIWRTNTGADTLLILQVTSGTTSWLPHVRSNGVNILQGVGTPQPTGIVPTVVGMRVTSGSSVACWSNGKLVASATHAVATVAGSFVGIGGNADNETMWSVCAFLHWNRALSDAELRAYTTNPWQVFAPPVGRRIFVPVGGGPIVKFGTAAAEAGGVARASGKGDSVGTAKAGAGGNAKATGVSVSVGTAKSVGGGVARGFGTGSGIITGTGAAEGGAGVAARGDATKGGTGKAVGGGTTKAIGSSSSAGTARASGGGGARAIGGAPPPPSSVDHYIHGWPVSGSGAVIVRIMP